MDDRPSSDSAFLEKLDRFGSSPLSFLLRYEAPWRTYSLDRGAVRYLEARRAAVVWTDPLCPAGELSPLLRSYARSMRSEHRSICLVAVSGQTARAAIDIGFSALKIGEEPWFDLARWHTPRGNRGKKYRWAANHARRLGVEIDEYRPTEKRNPKTEDEILEALGRWRAALGKPETNSLMRASPLEQAALKRIFIARRQGRVEAVLSCAHLPAVNGWYLEDTFRVPDAVNGATELMVAEALMRLGAAGASEAAFALAPMRGVADQLDPRARWIGRGLAGAIHRLDRRYGFEAMARYEARFEPTEWRPRYFAFLPALPRPAAIRATLRILSG
jgi:phosphatidylglycerol lysyltransferase